jgi:hypothetical protein
MTFNARINTGSTISAKANNQSHQYQISSFQNLPEVNAMINPESRVVAKVGTGQGFINPQALTIKNQLREYQINSIEDLPDVDEVNVVSGATLVYNSENDKYEVRQLQSADLNLDLDGGTF